MFAEARQARTARLLGFVSPHAQPGEQPVETLALMQRGVHPGLTVMLVVVWAVSFPQLRDAASFGVGLLVFLLAMNALALVTVSNALVITNQRWILVRLTAWRFRPKRIEESGDVASIACTFKTGLLNDKLTLINGGEHRRWWSKRVIRDEAERVAAAMTQATRSAVSPPEWIGTESEHPEALPPPPPNAL